MELNKEQEQSLEHDSVMQGHNTHVSGLLPLLIHSNFICVEVTSRDVGFQVLMAVIIKLTVFRGVTLCSLVYHCQHFRGSHCLHLQGRRVQQVPLKCS
jgi:hypothetical protein